MSREAEKEVGIEHRVMGEKKKNTGPGYLGSSSSSGDFEQMIYFKSAPSLCSKSHSLQPINYQTVDFTPENF